MIRRCSDGGRMAGVGTRADGGKGLQVDTGLPFSRPAMWAVEMARHRRA